MQPTPDFVRAADALRRLFAAPSVYEESRKRDLETYDAARAALDTAPNRSLDERIERLERLDGERGRVVSEIAARAREARERVEALERADEPGKLMYVETFDRARQDALEGRVEALERAAREKQNTGAGVAPSGESSRGASAATDVPAPAFTPEQRAAARRVTTKARAISLDAACAEIARVAHLFCERLHVEDALQGERECAEGKTVPLSAFKQATPAADAPSREAYGTSYGPSAIASLRARYEGMANRCEAALADNARLSQRVAELERYLREPVTFELAAKAMTEGCAAQLDEMGAENYVEATLNGPNGKRYAFRVQRVEGKTPDELKRQAESQRDAAIARAEKAESDRDAWAKSYSALRETARKCEEENRSLRAAPPTSGSVEACARDLYDANCASMSEYGVLALEPTQAILRKHFPPAAAVVMPERGKLARDIRAARLGFSASPGAEWNPEPDYMDLLQADAALRAFRECNAATVRSVTAEDVRLAIDENMGGPWCNGDLASHVAKRLNARLGLPAAAPQKETT